MRVLFLNQYFPPDPAPTGILLHEAAEKLIVDGIEATFVSAGKEYRASHKMRSRTFREAAALLRILWAGLNAPRPNLVLSATSPPCLVFVAHLVSLRHRAPHIHWVMDLYPEIAVALGEIQPGRLASSIGKLLGWCYRRASRVIALDEDMAALIRRHGVEPEIIGPWVFARVASRVKEVLSRDGAGKTDAALPGISEPWTWVYSGNLGRAHEWRTLLEAQKIIEERDPDIRLVFQGGGPSWPVAQAHAASLGLGRCEWLPYVSEQDLPESLLGCHVVVATQLPATQGLLWPSKLSLLMSLPRPILWVGPVTGAIASLLRERRNSGVFAPGNTQGVAEWVLCERKSAHPLESDSCGDTRARRHLALEQLGALIDEELNK